VSAVQAPGASGPCHGEPFGLERPAVSRSRPDRRWGDRMTAYYFPGCVTAARTLEEAPTTEAEAL